MQRAPCTPPGTTRLLLRSSAHAGGLRCATNRAGPAGPPFGHNLHGAMACPRSKHCVVACVHLPCLRCGMQSGPLPTVWHALSSPACVPPHCSLMEIEMNLHAGEQSKARSPPAATCCGGLPGCDLLHSMGQPPSAAQLQPSVSLVQAMQACTTTLWAYGGCAPTQASSTWSWSSAPGRKLVTRTLRDTQTWRALGGHVHTQGTPPSPLAVPLRPHPLLQPRPHPGAHA